MSLAALVALSPLLVVCLPALGSPFCRELLRDLAAQRAALEGAGLRLLLVHTGDEAAAARELFEPLLYVARIADPEGRLFDHFELPRARRGARTVAATLRAGRHGRARLAGDPSRLPGVVFLGPEGVRRVWRAEYHGQRIDWESIRTSVM